jgi:hypothetical protein
LYTIWVFESIGEIHVIDVTNGTSEELYLGSTLKRTAETSGPTPEAKHIRRASGENNNGGIPVKDITVGKMSFHLLDVLMAHMLQILYYMHMLMMFNHLLGVQEAT